MASRKKKNSKVQKIRMLSHLDLKLHLALSQELTEDN